MDSSCETGPAKETPEYYEAKVEARPDELALERSCAEVLRGVLDSQPGATVLDLCCGTGRSLSWILNHCNARQVVGVDASPVYLEFARNRLAADERLELIEGDAVSVALPLAQWDVVLLSRAYHHIEDRRKLAFLQRVRRLLSASGRTVIAESLLASYDESSPASYTKAIADYYRQVLVGIERERPDCPEHICDDIREKTRIGRDDGGDHKVSANRLLKDLEDSFLRLLYQQRVWPLGGSKATTSSGSWVFLARR